MNNFIKYKLDAEKKFLKLNHVDSNVSVLIPYDQSKNTILEVVMAAFSILYYTLYSFNLSGRYKWKKNEMVMLLPSFITNFVEHITSGVKSTIFENKDQGLSIHMYEGRVDIGKPADRAKPLGI